MGAGRWALGIGRAGGGVRALGKRAGRRAAWRAAQRAGARARRSDTALMHCDTAGWAPTTQR